MRFSVEAVVILLVLLGITENMKVSKKSKKLSGRNKLRPASFEPPTQVTVIIEESEEEVEEQNVDPCSSSSQENESEESVENDQEVPEFEFAQSKFDSSKAWNAATRLANRNPRIWRVDKQNSVILNGQYTISSPLSFKALIKEDSNGSEILEAVQSEYFGAGNDNNHRNSLKYRAKDQSQDDLLSLIEIALLGNVSDDRGESYCWCPSSIHQDLFVKDVDASKWHKSLFDSEFKYGMAGHNLAFQHMNVALKDVRHLSESTLNKMDQKKTLMYIHNYQPQCSETIDKVSFTGNAAEKAENVKNNWGLTPVSEFVERTAFSVLAPSAVMKKTVSIKPKQVLASNIAYPTKKSPTPVIASLSMSENEWPSLSALSSNEKAPKHKPKTINKDKKPVVIDI